MFVIVCRMQLGPLLLRLVAFITPTFVFGLGASAMDFQVTSWRGHTVLLASGEIISGDAARLEAALDGVHPLPHGVPVVLLDSPGGNVGAAFEISEVLDSRAVHMVVPDGARCASACAVILFIAGEYRTVESGGAFGQHSCSYRGRPDAECNEVIAQHAVAHDVAHGSIAAFTTYVPPSEIRWFTREDVDCWGISRYPFSDQSGFEKSEPCFFLLALGAYPAAQSAWRVDFLGNGYHAFLRPAADHLRELQVSLHCDETRPGHLFLSLDIAGSVSTISKVVTHASLEADPVVYQDLEVKVLQVDPLYSRATIEVPQKNVLPLLKETDRLKLSLFVHPPYKTMQVWTVLSGSREALIFAANHCVNPSGG